MNKNTGIRKKAVAVTYDSTVHEAPIISAKGTGIVADSIIREAEKHGVPMQENKSLVEMLSLLQLGEQIPPELYQVTAEILAFVYRIDQRVKEG